MSAYYNEIDPYAAEWLRNLITKGLIPDGEVDTRSIVDVSPDDVRGFVQAHYFAGIGGWGLALRLAGWPDDRPLWTGSCPCQPFSVAGKGAGTDDPRHLWPHFHRLISAVRPPVVMGEQVAGAAGYGWLDGVRADLEREGYASRGADLPALAVNAPHIRQRLYWIALDMGNADNARLERRGGTQRDEQRANGQVEPCSVHGDMADASDNGPSFGSHTDAERPEDERRRDADLRGKHLGSGSPVRDMANPDQGGRGRRPRDGDGERDGQAGKRDEGDGVAAGGGEDRLDVAHPGNDRTRRDVGAIGDGGRSTLDAGAENLRQTHWQGGSGGSDARSVGDGSFWSDHVWLTGSDGKARRSQPGLPLLAHGVSNRVGRLRAYGNAIVPPLAAEVIRAFMECEP